MRNDDQYGAADMFKVQTVSAVNNWGNQQLVNPPRGQRETLKLKGMTLDGKADLEGLGNRC